MSSKEARRVFIGGLNSTVTEQDVREQVSTFGNVSKVCLVRREDDGGAISKVFAYVTVEITDRGFKKCRSKLAKLGRLGEDLRVELARESFVERLRKQQKEEVSKEDKTPGKNSAPSSTSNASVRTTPSSTSNASVRTTPSSTSNASSRNARLSEQQRLAALQHRKQSLEVAKHLIASGLKGEFEKSSIITYPSSDGDVIQDKTKSDHGHCGSNGKITGRKAAAWLGLDSGSDTNDEASGGDDEAITDGEELSDDQVRFNIKPQFEGKIGGKLLRLQQRFGRDERFQIDERFAEESESSETLEGSTENTDGEDDISQQLKKEKNAQLEVLRGMLGKQRVAAAEKRQGHLFRDLSTVRFDPTQANSSVLEVKMPKQGQRNYHKVIEENEGDAVTTRSQHQAQLSEKPDVSSERFYHVANNFKDLFGGDVNEVESSSFFFLGESAEEPGISHSAETVGVSHSVEENSRRSVRLRKSHQQVADSSSSSEELDSEASEEDDHEPTGSYQFFLTSSPSNLAQNVQATVQRFMRTETKEEIQQQWEQRRTDLTRSYKKRHKDASRQQRKHFLVSGRQHFRRKVE